MAWIRGQVNLLFALSMKTYLHLVMHDVKFLPTPTLKYAKTNGIVLLGTSSACNDIDMELSLDSCLSNMRSNPMLKFSASKYEFKVC